MIDPSRVRISGALEPFAPGFATELARQGYVPRAVVHHLHLVAHASRWLTEQGFQVSDLATQAKRFLTARRAAGYTTHRTGHALRPMLTYLRTPGVVPPAPAPVLTRPVDVMLARYQQYLTIERGLGAATARGYPARFARFCPRGSRLAVSIWMSRISAPLT